MQGPRSAILTRYGLRSTEYVLRCTDLTSDGINTSGMLSIEALLVRTRGVDLFRALRLSSFYFVITGVNDSYKRCNMVHVNPRLFLNTVPEDLFHESWLVLFPVGSQALAPIP